MLHLLRVIGLIAVASSFASGQQVYWGSTDQEVKIQRFALDDQVVENVITLSWDPAPPSGVKDVEIDLPHGKLYWTDPESKAISRANLDGSEQEIVIDGVRANGIAVDSQAGTIYYVTDGPPFGGTTYRANLDGSQIEAIGTPGYASSDIELDLINGKMYWGRVQSGDEILRADIDGTNSELILDVNDPHSLALDVHNGKIYFSSGDLLRRANLDGSAVETINVPSPSSIRGIALDIPAQRIYWVSSNNLMRANLDGTGFEQWTGLGAGGIRGLVITSDCNNNGVADSVDVRGRRSDDCNVNGMPDECEPDQDCNNNAIRDICDIGAASSEDCTENGIPDECEADCNSNGMADSCDILLGTAVDLNFNVVPDECDACITSADCADLNGDLIRDDNCEWWWCVGGSCSATDIHFGDMGASGVTCIPDGGVDGNDAVYQALMCFSNSGPGSADQYPCDHSAPQAMHADAGGQFGACTPDGVCDVHDYFHALNVFAETSSCTNCPLDDAGGPAPVSPRERAGSPRANPVRVFMAAEGLQSLSATTGNTSLVMDPGTTAQVMVWMDDDSPAGDLLAAFQLVMTSVAQPQSGAMGTVTYVDTPKEWGDSIRIDQDRDDWVFFSLPFAVGTWPLESEIHGLFGMAVAPGLQVDPAAIGGIQYMAEFEIEASPNAFGEFELPFVVQAIAGNPQPLCAIAGPSGIENVVNEFQNLSILVGVSQCDDTTDCADLDGDGIRDDGCVWWTCVSDLCLDTGVVHADMGGAFGDCTPDGVADANDRFHALNCFSNASTTGSPGYPCEASPPLAYNVDAGGPFGDCDPDGVCDGNDAFHALNAFQGSTTCSCPSGPAPTSPQAPVVAVEAGIRLKGNRQTVRAGEYVEVDAFLDGPLDDLRGYQLHVTAAGGDSGTLNLVDIAVHDRSDRVFSGIADWQGFNVHTGQMVAGLDSAGVGTDAGAYLATFTFRSSTDAAGDFVVELLHEPSNPKHRTFLFPTPPGSRIVVESAEPAVIVVEAGNDRTRRHRDLSARKHLGE